MPLAGKTQNRNAFLPSFSCARLAAKSNKIVKLTSIKIWNEGERKHIAFFSFLSYNTKRKNKKTAVQISQRKKKKKKLISQCRVASRQITSLAFFFFTVVKQGWCVCVCVCARGCCVLSINFLFLLSSRKTRSDSRPGFQQSSPRNKVKKRKKERKKRKKTVFWAHASRCCAASPDFFFFF